MKCPFCGDLKSSVVDSRDTDDAQAVRRRRKCSACDRRYTTYERVEVSTLLIVKKDGRRQAFDRDRLLRGIERACEKRPVSATHVAQMVNDIERAAYDLGEREIAAHWFGEQVMASLRRLDEVAYVRFASVYRSFRDAEEFARELETLKSQSDLDAHA